jgi:hypothetical protein
MLAPGLSPCSSPSLVLVFLCTLPVPSWDAAQLGAVCQGSSLHPSDLFRTLAAATIVGSGSNSSSAIYWLGDGRHVLEARVAVSTPISSCVGASEHSARQR